MVKILNNCLKNCFWELKRSTLMHWIQRKNLMALKSRITSKMLWFWGVNIYGKLYMWSTIKKKNGFGIRMTKQTQKGWWKFKNKCLVLWQSSTVLCPLCSVCGPVPSSPAPSLLTRLLVVMTESGRCSSGRTGSRPHCCSSVSLLWSRRDTL